MAVEVVLNFFSGVPDPRWALPANFAAATIALLCHASTGPAVPAHPPENLGYRGFTIEDSDHGRFDHATIYKGLLFIDRQPYAIRIGPRLERSLVAHLPPDVASTFGSYLRSELARP